MYSRTQCDPSQVRSVRGLADGGVVSASRDVTAKLWSYVQPGEYQCTHTLSGHSGYINAVCVLPSGIIVLVSVVVCGIL